MFENGVCACLEPIEVGSVLDTLAILGEAGFKPCESGLEWLCRYWQEPVQLIGVGTRRLAERPWEERKIFGEIRLVVNKKYLDHESSMTAFLHGMEPEEVLPWICSTDEQSITVAVNDLPVVFIRPLKIDGLLAESISAKASKIETEEDEAFLDAPTFRPSENPSRVQKRFAKGIKPSKGKYRKSSDKVAPQWAIRPNEYKLHDVSSCRKACEDRRIVVTEHMPVPTDPIWAEWHRYDEETGKGWREEARRDPQTGLLTVWATSVPVQVDTFHLFPELESLSAMADALLRD